MVIRLFSVGHSCNSHHTTIQQRTLAQQPMPRKSPTHATTPSSSHASDHSSRQNAYTFRASDAEVLSNADEVLFRASVELATRQAQLRRSVVGRRVDEYRGTVSEVHAQSFKIKMDDGTYKSVPLSAKRATQLLSYPPSSSSSHTTHSSPPSATGGGGAAAGGGAPPPPSTTSRK